MFKLRKVWKKVEDTDLRSKGAARLIKLHVIVASPFVTRAMTLLTNLHVTQVELQTTATNFYMHIRISSRRRKSYVALYSL